MDIGKKYSWCEAISIETGEVLRERRFLNHKDEFIDFVGTLPRPIRVVMEATGNWAYLYECWEGLVEEVKLAYPLHTEANASARVNTGRIDSGILAHLGMAELVPRAYIPPREVRDLREVLRHRAFLVALQTKVKNRIHAYLWKWGIEVEPTDLFGKSGVEMAQGSWVGTFL